MTTTNLKKQQLLSLKAKIKGLAEGGARARAFIHAAKGDKRYRRWDEKRAIGLEARYHLLAYGLLRGIPYETLEPNSTKYYSLYARAKGIGDPMVFGGYKLNYNYLAQICQHHCGWEQSKWSPANIQRLIRTGTMLVTATVIAKEAS
jgi:hypothetical protein